MNNINILNYVKKPTIQNYKNLIEYFAKRIKLLMIESNGVLDRYYTDLYILDDVLKDKLFNNNSNKYSIYGFPYIGSSSNTYLKDSKKSRVKTFEYTENGFIDIKTKKKFLIHELNYTKNLDLAIDLDDITKLTQSIKNIKTLKELPLLVNLIENELERIVNKHSLEEKCVLYFESDYIDILKEIKKNFSEEFHQNICEEREFRYLEIQFKGNYFDILDMLKCLGCEKLKYNYEEEMFSFKFLGKHCNLDLQIFHSVEQEI